MCKTYRKVSRGQVWFLVDPKAEDYNGSIQGKNRPVLIVSNNSCNENSPVVHVVPFTTATMKNHLPTHVHFNDGKFDQTILCEQLKPVSVSLFYDKSYYKYTLSDDLMQRVDEAIAVQLGLSLIMPNSERFWKSVEQVIRLKVKDAMNDARVSAIDISKVSCLITKTIDDEVKVATDSEMDSMKAIEQNIDVPSDYPKLHFQEQFTGRFITKSIDNEIGKPVSCVIPEESFTSPPKPDVSVQIAQNSEKKRNEWTDENKKDFCDTYYRFGPQAAADKYGVKLGSAYRLKWNFEKELKNGTT